MISLRQRLVRAIHYIFVAKGMETYVLGRLKIKHSDVEQFVNDVYADPRIVTTQEQFIIGDIRIEFLNLLERYIINCQIKEMYAGRNPIIIYWSMVFYLRHGKNQSFSDMLKLVDPLVLEKSKTGITLDAFPVK